MSDSKSEKAPDSKTLLAEEKHEKVLHTRISPTLDREIKRRARGLGMSVSTVVRNVLLHTFDLVEDIVNDSANVALSIAGDDADESDGATTRHRSGRVSPTRGEAAVIAWQEAVLNRNAVCERCNAILATGTKAAIGIRETPGTPSIICAGCLDALGDEGRD